MDGLEYTRLANTFYNSKGLDSDINRIKVDIDLSNFVSQNQKVLEKKYKVALVFICLNPLYWEYAPAMVQSAKDFLLPGHKTDFFFWTDIPEDSLKINQAVLANFQQALLAKGVNTIDGPTFDRINQITNEVSALRKRPDVHIIPTVPVEWPYPTLFRYNLFLQHEEKLKDYDYIFYCDVDMRFVNIVGDEILGNGLTAAPHPGYALDKRYVPPYEPNEHSASYIKRPGRTKHDPDSTSQNKTRFFPEYYAGGFQGGKSDVYIQAMKACKDLIDTDLAKNYIPIWNDETAWNKYLSENPPEIMLTPSYIYPDSLINEYYIPLWGKAYQPKLVTLTKWFSVSKQGGEQLARILK